MRDGGGICDVDGLTEDFPTGGFLNLFGGLFKLGRSARANGNTGAFARELFCNGTAKSLAGGSHGGYAAL